MAKTRYEWTLVDVALWTAGAVTVPVYETSSAEQLRWILADSGAVGVVVESAAHAAMLAGIAADLPEPAALLDDRRRRGSAHPGPARRPRARGRGPGRADRRRAAMTPGTLATIIYTSGTTGRPKGCELTHGNFLAEVFSAIELPAGAVRGRGRARRCCSCRWRTCSGG